MYKQIIVNFELMLNVDNKLLMQYKRYVKNALRHVLICSSFWPFCNFDVSYHIFVNFINYIACKCSVVVIISIARVRYDYNLHRYNCLEHASQLSNMRVFKNLVKIRW